MSYSNELCVRRHKIEEGRNNMAVFSSVFAQNFVSTGKITVKIIDLVIRKLIQLTNDGVCETHKVSTVFRETLS